jgi:hypothetical protein
VRWRATGGAWQAPAGAPGWASGERPGLALGWQCWAGVGCEGGREEKRERAAEWTKN